MGIGMVHIVGAGPGSADLISLRGYRLLLQAEVIVADRLVPLGFLEELGIPADRTVIRLGDAGTRETQEEINDLMARHALAGRRVVRLKGGDPFVFGRGDEEVAHLTARGIPCDVVPGQSSCIAVATSAGFPLTSHGRRRSFAVVTARQAGGNVIEDLPSADTLVILMGVSVLGEIVAQLLADGWAAETPAALIEQGTTAWERRVTGPLGEIQVLAAEGNIASPTVFLVGVAASPGPRILFTGLDPTNFRTLGRLVHWPALHIVPKPEPRLPCILAELAAGRFGGVIFTSRVGVQSFFAAVAEGGHDARILAGTQIIAAGAGTALRLCEHGVVADAVPTNAGSDGILEIIAAAPPERVLLVQGTHAPGGLTDSLIKCGIAVERLALHSVIPNAELGRPLPEHDVIYFVSPSGVRAYWQTYGRDAFERAVWSIGSVTRAALADYGISSKVVTPHETKNTNASPAAH